MEGPDRIAPGADVLVEVHKIVFRVYSQNGVVPSDRERVDGRLSVLPNVVVESSTLLIVFELDSLASLVKMPGLKFTEVGAVVLKDQDSNGEWWR